MELNFKEEKDIKTKDIMNIVKFFYCWFLILNSFWINAQQNTLKFPQDFEEIPISNIEEAYWFSQYSLSKHLIELDCNEVVVKVIPNRKEKSAWLVESKNLGILFGQNEGESTGGLYIKPRNHPPILLENCNVKFLHTKKNNSDILFFEVDNYTKKSHLKTINRNRVTQDIEIKELVELNDIPQCIYYDENNVFYIVGSNNFYKLKDNEIIPLISDNSWKNIIAADIYKVSNNIFLIGVLGGIIEVNTFDRKIKLFVIKESR